MKSNTQKESSIVTLGDYLNWASEYFGQQDLYYGHGTDNPWDEAVMLVLYVLKLPGENDRSMLAKQLQPEQRVELIKLAKKRVADRLPVPYITGEAWFAGERYIVNPSVLIPRSPMAETIGTHFQPWLGKIQPKRILDMCTGSGCLAIFAAKEFPEAQVDAVDISPPALDVARQNILLHNCADRVNAIESDLFSELSGRKYDIIISNPPYVSAEEMSDLPVEYTHEPELALASGDDGLDLSIQIIREAKQYLTDDGLLFVEVGNSWPTLVEHYPQIPFTWLEFEYGGEGVFMLTAEQLKEIEI